MPAPNGLHDTVEVAGGARAFPFGPFRCLGKGTSLRSGLAIVVLVVSGFSAFANGAHAATTACTQSSGVTVIVEYTRGTIERGCAPGHPANGLAALRAAGFAVDGTAQYGDAFVCRIDGNPSDQPCTSTPPGNAYWAYSHARASDTGWTYWTVGATESHPQPGSIDAWAFGADVRPSVSPAAVAPPAAPPPTRPPPTIARSVPTTGAPPVGARALVPTVPPTITAPRATTRGPSTPPPSTAPRAAVAPKPTAPTVTSSTQPPAVHIIDRASAPAPPKSSSPGSPLPTVLAVVALAAAGAVAFLVVHARRRAVP